MIDEDDEDEPRIRDILRRRMARRWAAFAAWIRYSVLRQTRPVAKGRLPSATAEALDAMFKVHYGKREIDMAARPNMILNISKSTGGRRWVSPTDATKKKP